jgi:hypothetical protein
VLFGSKPNRIDLLIPRCGLIDLRGISICMLDSSSVCLTFVLDALVLVACLSTFVISSSVQVSPRIYSTVTDLARFLGWSTSQPRRTAM